MSDFAIKAEALSKRYTLGLERLRYTTVTDLVTSRFRRRESDERVQMSTLWALDDISFEIEPGEAVGFIGRNGAGKSTLLKILSRITKPTTGRASLNGRVGSLLEVGTGFHQELTGHENIYMNGALLGLTKSEIDKRYDAIVEFSEVKDFLHTPIKRYSSGMVVRLAFAVAAHLEPEILLVDEVLAVGDLAFQRKCLGKMTESASEGRTVLFVSHNMAVIQALCKRGIFLDHGKIRTDADVTTAVADYLRSMEEQAEALDLSERLDRTGKQQIIVNRVAVTSAGDAMNTLRSGHPATFRFEVSGVQRGLYCIFHLYDQLGHPVTTVTSAETAPADTWEEQEEPFFECHVPKLPLIPGRYRLDFTLCGTGGHVQDHLEGAAYFDVADGVLDGRPVSGRYALGSVAFPVRWRGPVAAIG